MDPDGLERLWTPHRMAYVTRGEAGGGGPAGTSQIYDEARGETPPCPFCTIPSMPDEEGLVVARGERIFAVLNLYPYNAGHLMVVPYRHVADYTEASAEEVIELAEFTRHAMAAIRKASAPHGFNIGINQGSAGGAGIAAHLHQHVVPRWRGDANFMPVIGHTKVLPQLLADTRRLLAEAW